MTKKHIREELKKLQDLKYREFQSRLMPTVSPSRIIGVRTPELRKLAANLCKDSDAGAFLCDLPHDYFDEDQLHAFVVSNTKDFEVCIGQVEVFLPYIDNWATCDQLSPKSFKNNKEPLLKYIKKWIKSNKTYVVRFAIGMLMRHYLEEDFDASYPNMVAAVSSVGPYDQGEFYVNMMRAWYFATALAKQYDAVIPFIEECRLDEWTHNRTIQKSVESYRITPQQKQHLKELRRK